MNKIKCIILFLLLVMATPKVSAQSNFKAMEEALAQVIHKYSLQADTLARHISSRYSKDPEAQIHIGRSYYRNREYTKAQLYIDKALKINSHYGLAYILEGDMAAFQGDSTKAAEYYKKCITEAPKEINGYLRYVEIISRKQPQEAIKALEAMNKNCPDYPVALSQAYIWYSNLDFAKASEAFSRVDSADMDEENTSRYALSLYYQQKFPESLNIAEKGLQHYVGSLKLFRVSFYDLAEMKRNKEAFDYGAKLFQAFTKGCDIKETRLDNEYYGLVCNRLQRYDDAMKQMANFINRDSIFTAEDRYDMSLQVKKIIDGIKAGGDFNLAAQTYSHFLNDRSSTSDYDNFQLTEIYRDQVDDATAMKEDATHAYQQLDSIYNIFERNHSNWNQIDAVYYYHAIYCTNILDPNAAKGLAIPFYNKLISYELTNKNVGTREKGLLKNAYVYMSYYYANNRQKAKAKEYARKVLEIDPTNTNARNLIKTL